MICLTTRSMRPALKSLLPAKIAAMHWFPRSSAVPLQRRWISDVVHFGKKSHVVGGNLIINVTAVATARIRNQPLVSWTAIWIKAIALAGQRWPELRTCYLPYPWPRMYLHPHTVATIVIERNWNGAPAVFFDKIRNPEAMSLAEIDGACRGKKQSPIESVGGYRFLIRIARLPWFLRRIVWSFGLYWSGRLRSRYIGTYSVNALPGRRHQVLQSTTPISFSLFHGIPEPNGDMLVQFFADHRVFDGMTLYRMMRTVEAIMNNAIVGELTTAAVTQPKIASRR
jgi:hypothetical protein